MRRSTRRGGGGRRDGLGRFGLFDAKARSARETEAPVRGVRVQEGGGACAGGYERGCRCAVQLSYVRLVPHARRGVVDPVSLVCGRARGDE